MITLENYLKTKPTREEVMLQMCRQANSNVMHIREVGVFKELGEIFNFTLDDFYDDQSIFSEDEQTFIGLYNWVIKEECK